MNASQNDTLTSTMALNSTKKAAMMMNVNSFLIFIAAPPNGFSPYWGILALLFKFHTNATHIRHKGSQKNHGKITVHTHIGSDINP